MDLISSRNRISFQFHPESKTVKYLETMLTETRYTIPYAHSKISNDFTLCTNILIKTLNITWRPFARAAWHLRIVFTISHWKIIIWNTMDCLGLSGYNWMSIAPMFKHTWVMVMLAVIICFFSFIWGFQVMNWVNLHRFCIYILESKFQIL